MSDLNQFLYSLDSPYEIPPYTTTLHFSISDGKICFFVVFCDFQSYSKHK
jgi:hypothetical protein